MWKIVPLALSLESSRGLFLLRVRVVVLLEHETIASFAWDSLHGIAIAWMETSP